MQEEAEANKTVTELPDKAELRLLKRKSRAFELDFIRGLAMCVMIWQHTAYDLRYIFGYNIFSCIEPDNKIFWGFVHPFFLSCFVVVSGICCQFSKNNFRRAIKLGIIAILFTIGTVTADHFLDLGCTVYFNVLHLLTIGMFLFAIFDKVEQKKTGSRESRGGTMFLLAVLLVFFILTRAVPYYDGVFKTPWIFIAGLEPAAGFSITTLHMADHIGIVPWLGMFFFGVVIGRMAYKEKKTFFPGAPKAVRVISAPIEWIGRHSLIIYLVHQPLIMGILKGLQFLGVIK